MISPGIAATLPELVKLRAAEFRGGVFFVSDDQRITFAGLEERSREVAKGLLAIGARKGTRVGLIYPNVVDFLTMFFGVTRIGAIALPLSTLSTPDELRGLLTSSDTEILLSIDKYRSRDFKQILGTALSGFDLAKMPPLLSPQVPSLRRIFLAGSQQQFGAWSSEALLSLSGTIGDDFLASVEARVVPADRAIVVHTSGSMSLPKGVLHSHGTLVDHMHHLNKIGSLTSDDILFSSAPFFWIGGLVFALIGCLEAGARLVCSNSQSAESTLDLIETERPTMAIGFPQSVAHLVKDPSYSRRDFSSVRRGNLVEIMAVDVRPADSELRHNRLGTTETASVYLTDPEEGPLPEALRGSYGRPTPGFEVRVIDPQTGAGKPPGEVGEIIVRGRYLMEGYIGKERHETFDADGWYHTGDMASANEDGYIFFKGRLGDMIKTSGANVSPREVEEMLTALTGRRAHVLGIDDPKRGQVVVAAIVADHNEVNEEALREQLKVKLSSYKIPRRILFLSEGAVPMMSSGKLDKRKLTELFRDT